MWQTDWTEKGPPTAAGGAQQATSLGPEQVDHVYLLHWREHCLECAQPDCYRVCPLYVQRRDRRCARFKNGIFPNPLYAGLYPYGAEIQFRRWAALESTFGYGALPPRRGRGFDRIDRFLLKCIRPISSALRRISPDYRLSRAYGILRQWLIRAATRRSKVAFDEFIVELWNPQPDPVRLVIECHQDGPRFRASLLAAPGRTKHQIPVEAMNIDLYAGDGMIRVYPENDAEAHVVFTWLDFVRYVVAPKPDPRPLPAPSASGPAGPAPKVKCVIWDLDNTVWNGVLGEQDPEQVSLRPYVQDIMLALDAKGILQSIASKNDHDEAWSVLRRLGVSHLFLFPRIDWQPKSVNIREIVRELNIGADACAFVDDSAFERGEVRARIPEMRVYDETSLPHLLERAEFDVPVTDESRQRRRLYSAESERRQLALGYGGDYEAFLRSCDMQATLFSPAALSHVGRSLELLHRTNQLNLTTHRYSREEFEALLGDRNALCICTSCRDRFGDYGTIGFASLKPSAGRLYLVDFVMSCRVAQKRVEHAWFGWVVRRARAAGFSKLHARYLKTPRNHVLLDTFLDVGFVEIEKCEGGSLLELDCAAEPPASGLVSVDGTAVGAIPSPEGSLVVIP